jgi:hypothetical protein
MWHWLSHNNKHQARGRSFRRFDQAYASKFNLLLWGIVALMIAGCEAQGTPVPAVLPPTPTDTPVPTLPPPVRYAFMANTAGFVEDLDQMRATGLVEQLSDNNTDEGVISGYDIAVTFGLVEGWEQAPVTLHLALIVNPAIVPMDNALVVDTIRRSLNPGAIIEGLGVVGASAEAMTPTDGLRLRTDLANGGLPDGADIILAHRTLPGYDQIAQQLNTSGLRVALQAIQRDTVLDTLARKRAHLIFAAWTTPEERAAWVEQVGEAHVIDLYAIPISYRAVPDVTLEFTPDGFPIGRRE